MKIAVNSRVLIPNQLDGIGRFTFEVLKRITRSHKEHEFVFIFDRPFSEEFVFSSNITPVVAYPPARHPLLWYAFFQHGVPFQIKKNKGDIFFSPDGWIPLNLKIPVIDVIHDLNFFHQPHYFSFLVRNYYNTFFPKFASKANRILTVSEFTKSDIVKNYSIDENKIDVVYNGISENYKPISEIEKIEIKNCYTQGKDFLLFLGSVHPRKNLANCIKAFDIFKISDTQQIKFLIVGQNKWMNDIDKLAYENSKFKNDIIFTGRLSDSEIVKIMPSALALVYVSLFEGFGIPLIEAMACDVPVITSQTTSMPEIAGNAALISDPHSPENIAQNLKILANDSNLRSDLIEKGKIRASDFSWNTTACKIWQTIEKYHV